MSKKQYLIFVSTILLTLLIFFIPMGTTSKDITGYFVTYDSNIEIKIALMIATAILGIATTIYFKDKK